MRGLRRVVGRTGGTAPQDRFAAYLPLDGPVLVGGPRPVHDPRLDADPRLVVLMPHLRLSKMSGGPNTILQVTARLLPLGVRGARTERGGPARAHRTADWDRGRSRRRRIRRRVGTGRRAPARGRRHPL